MEQWNQYAYDLLNLVTDRINLVILFKKTGLYTFLLRVNIIFVLYIVLYKHIKKNKPIKLVKIKPHLKIYQILL